MSSMGGEGGGARGAIILVWLFDWFGLIDLVWFDLVYFIY